MFEYFKKFLTEEKDETEYPVINTFYQDIPIQIENPIGSIRKGTGKEGAKWQTKMYAHYGRVKNTVGKDDDMIDIFIGPNKNSQVVYCIFQKEPMTGFFDEHKYILGTNSEEEAKLLYLKHYDDVRYFGDIIPMDINSFKSMCFTNIKANLFMEQYKLGSKCKIWKF